MVRGCKKEAAVTGKMNVCRDYRSLASNVYACFLIREIFLVSGAKQKQGMRINTNGVSWTPGLKRRGLL